MERREVALSVRHLAEFLLRTGSIDARFSGLERGAVGTRIHRELQRKAGAGYTAEAALSISIDVGDYCYRLSGRADGVIEKGGVVKGAKGKAAPKEEQRYIIDEIKTVTVPLERISLDSNPAYWAQGCLYAHMLCEKRGLPGCGVQITYVQVETGEISRFERQYSADELKSFVIDLLRRYERWAVLAVSRREKRDAQLKALAFPFGAYRDGQYRMAAACYTVFKDEGRLLCCAPTGTGKTISALFPALKALGEGYGERIFYLTAKTVARKAAEDALKIMRRGADGGLDCFYSLTLTAKDKICFLDKRACLPEMCPYADGYYDRLNDALYQILRGGGTYGRREIEEAGKKYCLCPYELSLDLALWSDLVVGDYNYLFDPVVHLQRFFSGSGDFLFLVDEAHNLVERSREMYSSLLSKSSFSALKKQLPASFSRFHRVLSKVNGAFTALQKRFKDENAEVLCTEEPPAELVKAVDRFCTAAASFLEENRGSAIEEPLLTVYFDALFFCQIAAGYDRTYVTLAQYRKGRDTSVKLFCLDASQKLDVSLSKGRASVLFSATLQPLAYYRETLGAGRYAKTLRLDSPFPEENMGLFVADGVSTKYRDRAASLGAVAALLAGMVNGKRGNYIAYFPSYSYMRQALEAFLALGLDVKTLVQHSGMDEEARDEFLAAFKPENAGEVTLLGFCVMGGVFAEGVDLPGDTLVGSAVVGVGLPQLGAQPDAIRRYYDDQNGCGFEYAYQFPGMNKVMQAAGRVIRTERDCGAVLLIDSRFTSARYQELFPPHWGHWRRADSASLPRLLAEFWQSRR